MEGKIGGMELTRLSEVSPEPWVAFEFPNIDLSQGSHERLQP